MKTEMIERIVGQCDGTPKGLQEAVNRLLMEDTTISTGDTVAIVDEDTAIGGMVGKARVKSFSEDKQYANCELPNGQVIPVLTNTLYVVGK